ncbi:hypothetical protein CSUI_005091 [Cystoisospora suis]|uniref:Uncharacterized protein n=1 Tax=Cystoisospora suis TaxID=483139 RepID=A0A2C6KUY8_9APIC|nr:hypothetical protein CSUI_005091 [Cystoisospora suis]
MVSPPHFCCYPSPKRNLLILLYCVIRTLTTIPLSILHPYVASASSITPIRSLRGFPSPFQKSGSSVAPARLCISLSFGGKEWEKEDVLSTRKDAKDGQRRIRQGGREGILKPSCVLSPFHRVVSSFQGIKTSIKREDPRQSDNLKWGRTTRARERLVSNNRAREFSILSVPPCSLGLPLSPFASRVVCPRNVSPSSLSYTGASKRNHLRETGGGRRDEETSRTRIRTARKGILLFLYPSGPFVVLQHLTCGSSSLSAFCFTSLSPSSSSLSTSSSVTLSCPLVLSPSPLLHISSSSRLRSSFSSSFPSVWSTASFAIPSSSSSSLPPASPASFDPPQSSSSSSPTESPSLSSPPPGLCGPSQEKGTGASENFRQKGDEQIIEAPPSELPPISWRDISRRIEGPRKPPLMVTTDGDFDPDRPRPPRPLENIVNLDPAATFLVQLPHEVPSPSLSLPSTSRENPNREGGKASASEGSPTVGNDRKTGSALLRNVTGREHTQNGSAYYSLHDEQVHAISRTRGEAEKLLPLSYKLDSPLDEGLCDRVGEESEERKLPGHLTPLDVEGAPGGAWVRGKWMSDEEIDRAIEEGEAKLLPMVGKRFETSFRLRVNTPAEMHEEINKVAEKERLRAQMKEHPHLADEVIDSMDVHQMKDELRLRGYRTGGPIESVRLRLKQAVVEGPRTFQEGTQDDLPSDTLSQSFIQDSQHAYQTYRDALEEISQPVANPEDPAQVVRRWIARTELFKAADDPVGYFHLDMNTSSQHATAQDLAQIQKGMDEREERLSEEEKQEIFQRQRHDLMAETVPKTFQPKDEDVVAEENPTTAKSEWDHLTVEERKRLYLLGNPNSIIDETVHSLAEAFAVPEDFIGDFLCRQGMVDPPIPVDVPLRELADPAAVWNLIEYLQLQDPARIHDMYPMDTIEHIAEDFNCPVQRVLDACDALRIKLPFGVSSRVNVDCYGALTKLLDKMLFPTKTDDPGDEGRRTEEISPD